MEHAEYEEHAADFPELSVGRRVRRRRHFLDAILILRVYDESEPETNRVINPAGVLAEWEPRFLVILLPLPHLSIYPADSKDYAIVEQELVVKHLVSLEEVLALLLTSLSFLICPQPCVESRHVRNLIALI